MKGISAKNGGLLKLSQYTPEFEAMNMLQKDQDMGKKLIKEMNAIREALEDERKKNTQLIKAITEANEKVSLLQQGKIEGLKDSSYWLTQERYKRNIAMRDREIEELRWKLKQRLQAGLKLRNERKEKAVFRYLIINEGIIPNYRKASSDLNISLSTLHGIVKRLHEMVVCCPKCNILTFKDKEDSMGTGRLRTVLRCMKCKKIVAK